MARYEFKESKKLVERSVHLIQDLIRGKYAREQFEEVKGATATLEKIALSVQNIYRGYIARNHLAFVIYARRRCAGIQATTTGCRSEFLSTKMSFEKFKQMLEGKHRSDFARAATKIQVYLYIRAFISNYFRHGFVDASCAGKSPTKCLY
jgi:hypothetical protein